MKMIRFVPIFVFSLLSFAADAEKGFITKPHEVMDGMYLVEGDILVPKDQLTERHAVPNDADLWPGGVVPYKISKRLSAFENRIRESMNDYENETCIRFLPRTNETNYVFIINAEGCWSHPGMNGTGRQYLSLGVGCTSKGVILHELGHLIGLFHEHNRPDRDIFITINFTNIPLGDHRNFEITPLNATRVLGSFDYNSIMLYGAYSFSFAPTQLKTIISIEEGIALPEPHEKTQLSEGDIAKINELYSCNEV